MLESVLDWGSRIVLTGSRPAQSQIRRFVTKFPFSLSRILTVLVVLCFGVVTAHANTDGVFTISVLKTGEIRVQAHLLTAGRSWSFRNAYAGILGIADRVEDFHATTDSQQDARAGKIATGEFRSELDAYEISYTVKLSEPGAANVSHVSWIVGDYGLLMLADLVPQDFTSATVRFELPPDWSVHGFNLAANDRSYYLPALEKAVFFVGRSLKSTTQNTEGMPVTMVVGGTWSFKDHDVHAAARRIMKKYYDLTGLRLVNGAFIMIAPLPVKVGATKWRAETRGSTVVLLIDPNAGFKNWIGQLSVIFTHELFHLWVPNWLRLKGDYDWFFEGFTLYTALQTALQLKLIDFQEYLDTLARVYDSYLSYSDDLSLIEASERRWTTSGSLVYDKGMLVAFLYDLKIRKESNGNTTLANRYRELFAGRVAANVDGNDAIIALLDSPPAMSGFAEGYVARSAKLELETILPAYGLSLDSSTGRSQLRIDRKLNAEQKQLLRSLGYRK